MENHAKAVRFEVLVNGERRCVAGIGEFGVLAATIDWVIRHPARKPDDYTLKKWSGQRLRYHIGGMIAKEDAQSDEHVAWDFGDLTIGDDILIRILGPGEFDEPSPPDNEDTP